MQAGLNSVANDEGRNQLLNLFVYISKQLFFLALLFSFSLGSCSSKADPDDKKWVQMTGREPDRIPLYRIRIPDNWTVALPPSNVPLTDSRNALCEITIDQSIRMAIHNFPTETRDQSIPPQAQIQRWMQQLKDSDSTRTLISPQSFSGYTGLLLEAEGKIDGAPAAVMGWALQIGKEQFRMLANAGMPVQMRADITIKVTGPPDKIALRRSEITRAAKSFELIEEIPAPR
jgi:hypothetical protein